MSYSIYFNKRVKKFVDGLDEAQKDRIKKKLRALKEDPFAGDVKNVKGREGVLYPDGRRMRINGKIAFILVLEVVGPHPELTANENIYIFIER
jgi:hypothetical protein